MFTSMKNEGQFIYTTNISQSSPVDLQFFYSLGHDAPSVDSYLALGQYAA